MHATDSSRRSRAAQGIALVIAAIAAVGCGGEPPLEAQIGSGPTWNASIRQGNGGDLCLDVRSDRPVSTLCGIEKDGTNTWRTEIGLAEVLIVTSDAVGASSAVVRMAAGHDLPVELVRAPDITDLGVFVVALPVRPVAVELVIQAADGETLETVPLDDP